ncbi:MAG: RNA polymerase sigma factor [Gemmatimonadaceae bacterium]|nr:RNA polymerase sigma factor [Gemmatimonadaceae bacterium]
MRALDGVSDADVIQAVLDGNTDAFAIILERYRDNYTRFAVRVLGSGQDADDALQLAFIRAFRNLSGCRDRDRFSGWMYQIVVNECRTFGAKRSRRESMLVRDPEVLAKRAVSSPAPDTTELEEIQRALDQLHSSYREAFVLKHVEDLSYEEMSELTGVNVSALKMRVKRACMQLREILTGVHSD